MKNRWPIDSQTQWLLVTQRVADPSARVPGLPEAYFCTQCGDYFGLAWWDATRAHTPQAVVVLGPISSEEYKSVLVFCPKCEKQYPEYGDVPRFGVEPLEASRNGTKVLGEFVTTFPSGMPSGGFVADGEMVFERIVLLMTGPLPPPDIHEKFTTHTINHFLSGSGNEIRVSQDCGVAVNVLRAETISDDTSWLTGVLNDNIYAGVFGTRSFVTNGPIEVGPPIERLLFCAILQPAR